MEPEAVKPPEMKVEEKVEPAPTAPAPEVKPEVDEFSAAILNPEPAKPKTVEEKKDLAAEAMMGPELAAKRDAESHVRALKAEKATIKSRLEEIAKLKEQSELAWVTLDEARSKIKETLAPLTTKEDQIETEEKQLEVQEDQTPTPKERRVIEEKIWAQEDSRRTVEKEKWGIEEKLISTEDKMAAQTAEYRKILDEEDALFKRLDAIEAELTQ